MHALPATTLDRRHEWTEPSVIALPGALLEQPHPDWQVMALDISRRLGIRTVVRITKGTWEVLTLSDPPAPRFEIVASAACSLTRDDEHRCPMQLTPGNGEYCSMRGGPWTSSSIHAAAGWRDQRNRFVAAIGCDTCEGTRHQFQGKILNSGGPITIAPTRPPPGGSPPTGAVWTPRTGVSAMPERLVSTPSARMGQNSAGPCAIGQPQKVTRKTSRWLARD